MSIEKMKTNAAADYIGKSASWLNKTRLNGSGPTYLKIGGGVLYTQSDLDAWLHGKRRTAVYDFANDNNVAVRASA